MVCLPIVRTRVIVAIAALIAAVALVAGPKPAGALVPSAAQAVDAEQLRAVTVDAPMASPVASIEPLDTANRSAGWLGPATALGDAVPTPVIPDARPTRPQPAARAIAVPKFTWHFDSNISWYGPGFYGGHTACGLELTRDLVGVASPTLPCGTLVTFRNPANGRQVTAPVVDRGPYVSGRLWDMTAGLCTYLRHCYTGSMQWSLGAG